MTARRRLARKRHRCEHSGHGYGTTLIEPGEVYLEHKDFPGGDAGFADAAGHPVRMAECARCAMLYGRGSLLDPMSPEQAYQQGLVGL